jgi:hypothetical protein
MPEKKKVPPLEERQKLREKTVPTVDRDRELQDQIQQAKEAGVFMIAIWRVDDGKIYMHRQMRNFPLAEVMGAMELLERDLQSINQPTPLGKKA